MTEGRELASAFAGRRVLVLGASGFIGRRLAARLDALGARVTRTIRAGGRAVPTGETVATDLSAAGQAAALIEAIGPVLTFNMASYGVLPDQRDPELAERLNHQLPAELAAACRAGSGPGWEGLHLVHAGSALEYGTATGDLAETTAATPTTLYGRTKLAGTLAVAGAVGAGQLRAVTARLFTVYGPGEAPGRLLPGLIRARDAATPIPLTDGAQRRDFTFVDDVVEGLLRLAVLRGSPDPIVNIATGRLTTVREFVLRAAVVLGLREDRLAFGELVTRPEEMRHDPVSVRRLRALTGWQPETSLEEGVRRTVAADGHRRADRSG